MRWTPVVACVVFPMTALAQIAPGISLDIDKDSVRIREELKVSGHVTPSEASGTVLVSGPSCSPNPVPLTATATAFETTCMFSELTATGNHSVAAHFISANPNAYQNVVSVTAVRVTPPPEIKITTTTLKVSPESIPQGTEMTFSGNVTPLDAIGTVSFVGSRGLPCTPPPVTLTATEIQYRASCVIPHGDMLFETYFVRADFAPDDTRDYTTSFSQAISFMVTSGPVITLPADQTVDLSSGSVRVTWPRIMASDPSGISQGPDCFANRNGISPVDEYLTGATFSRVGVFAIRCTATNNSNDTTEIGFTVVVNAEPTTITLTFDPQSAAENRRVTVRGDITPTLAAGRVTFGGDLPCDLPAVTVTGGSYEATCTVSQPAGTYATTAVFEPDNTDIYRRSDPYRAVLTVITDRSDTTSPVITLPADQTVALSSGSADVRWPPIMASDPSGISQGPDCFANRNGISPIDEYLTGATFSQVGVFTIQCAATDASSNRNSAARGFNVTVNPETNIATDIQVTDPTSISVADTVLTPQVTITPATIAGTLSYSLQRLGTPDLPINLGSRRYPGDQSLPLPQTLTAGQWRMIARFTPDNTVTYRNSEDSSFVLSVGVETVTVTVDITPGTPTVGQPFTVIPTAMTESANAPPAGTVQVIAISGGRTLVDQTRQATAPADMRAVHIAASDSTTEEITIMVRFIPTNPGRHAQAGITRSVTPMPDATSPPVTLGISGTLTVNQEGTLAVSATALGTQLRVGTVTVSVQGIPLPGLPENINLATTSGSFAVTAQTTGVARIVLTYAGGQCVIPDQTPCQQTYAAARLEQVIVVQNSSQTAVSSSVTVRSTPSLPPAGSNVTLTATVEAPPGTPTTDGTVQFSFDGQTLGDPVTASEGQYQIAVRATRISAGTHTYAAEFTPTDDTMIQHSTSSVETIIVSALPRDVPMLVLTGADGSPGSLTGLARGAAVHIRAFATAPTGEFLDGMVSLSSDLFMSPRIQTVIGGRADIMVNSPVAGTYMIEAIFTPSLAQYDTATATVMIAFVAEPVRTAIVISLRAGDTPIPAGGTVTPGNSVTVDATVIAARGESVDGRGLVYLDLTSADGSAMRLTRSVSSGGVYAVDIGGLPQGVYTVAASWQPSSQVYVVSQSESRTLHVIGFNYAARASCGPFDWIEDGNGLSQTYIRITGHSRATQIAVTLDNTAQAISGDPRRVLSAPGNYGIDMEAPASLFRTWRIQDIYGPFGRGDVMLEFDGVEQSALDCDRLTRSSPVHPLTGFGNRGSRRNLGDGDR